MKLYAPDGACKQMEVGGRIYEQRNYDGPFIVHNPADARAMKASGCFEGSLTPIARPTRRGCWSCGSRMFVRPAEGGKFCLKCEARQ